MTQEAHTPEPWRVRFYRSAPTIDCVQGAPEHPEKYGREIINRMARPASERAKSDARRIVACVNAFAGIPIEAIEGGVVAELVEAARGMLPNNLNMACNMSDEAIIPLDVTFGELRALFDALAKLEASK